jgi:hypothetical protein
VLSPLPKNVLIPRDAFCTTANTENGAGNESAAVDSELLVAAIASCFRPFCDVALIVGLLPAVLCVACRPFPLLSPQYPTGSLVAVAGTVPSLF